MMGACIRRYGGTCCGGVVSALGAWSAEKSANGRGRDRPKRYHTAPCTHRLESVWYHLEVAGGDHGQVG